MEAIFFKGSDTRSLPAQIFGKTGSGLPGQKDDLIGKDPKFAMLKNVPVQNMVGIDIAYGDCSARQVRGNGLLRFRRRPGPGQAGRKESLGIGSASVHQQGPVHVRRGGGAKDESRNLLQRNTDQAEMLFCPPDLELVLLRVGGACRVHESASGRE